MVAKHGPRVSAGVEIGGLARGPRLGRAKPDPYPHGGLDLDARAAHLAVALREMDVAERQERAGHVNGEQQGRPRHEPPDVEVASVLARRDRAQARGRERRPRRLGRVVGDRPASVPNRLLATPLHLHQLGGRSHADHAGMHAGGHGDAGELVGAGQRAVELPAHEERLREDVGEEAEAGDDAVDTERGRLVGEERHLEHVPGLGAVDEDRARERVAQAEIEGGAVLVPALARELPVEPVAGLEDDLVAGRHAGDGLDRRVPAVVRGGGRDSHSSAPIRVAAARAAPISSSVQVRGSPS